MANAINQSVFGYPQPFGSKIVHKCDHYGPTSYVQYATTPAGDIINASDLSFGGFDDVGVSWAGYSNSGNYIVQVMQSKANDVPAQSAGTRVTIQWFTVTGGAFGAKSTEASAATNLNSEYVRLNFTVV